MRRVILNADDLGYDPAVSEGLLESMRRGVVSSATFIVNAPASHGAAQQAHGLSLGLHLNLVRFNSISEGQPLIEGALALLHADFVERETRAQLDAFERLLRRAPTHIDVHKHAHTHPSVLEGLCRVARASRLPVRSISSDMRRAIRAHGVQTNDVFIGDAGADAFWTLEQFERVLDALPAEGVIELMCHPGHAPSTMASGYAAQREVELATFTSEAAKQALHRRGLELSSWSGV